MSESESWGGDPTGFARGAGRSPVGSISKAWFILVALLLLTGVANAGRKRVVVLDFEGDKAEKFHADVVKLIKKSHTVVSTDKWNGAAEEMSASKLTDKNVKKVAKKLKVDGIVSGTVEKRRDEYILRLKLRSGVSGELVGSQINIKSESAKLDGTAAKDVKDELIEVIADLESNREGGAAEDEEDEEKPKKGTAAKKPADDEADEEKPKKGTAKKPADEEDEEKPKKSGFSRKSVDDEEKPKKGTAAKKPAEEDEEKPKKGVAAKKPAEEDEEKPKKGVTAKKPADEVAAKKPADDEEKPKKQPAKPPADEADEEKPKKATSSKKVAARTDDDDDDGGELSASGEVSSGVDRSLIYTPGERAVDAVVGMSFTARRMSFAYDPAEVTKRPAGYSQIVPVPGLYIDATVYPLAVGHKRKDILRGLGATVMFDRVLTLSSKNPNDGMKLKTTEQRFALGVAFRYPLGEKLNVGSTLRYGRQQFTIDGMAAIPNVHYSLIDLSGFLNYTLNPKMVLNVSGGLLLPTDAGAITKLAQYGRATIFGIEVNGGLDYMLTKTIFARGEIRVETLGYSFKGEGENSTGVSGARDTYFGGTASAGYLF
jgi:hypothetical protein